LRISCTKGISLALFMSTTWEAGCGKAPMLASTIVLSSTKLRTPRVVECLSFHWPPSSCPSPLRAITREDASQGIREATKQRDRQPDDHGQKSGTRAGRTQDQHFEEAAHLLAPCLPLMLRAAQRLDRREHGDRFLLHSEKSRCQLCGYFTLELLPVSCLSPAQARQPRHYDYSSYLN